MSKIKLTKRAQVAVLPKNLSAIYVVRNCGDGDFQVHTFTDMVNAHTCGEYFKLYWPKDGDNYSLHHCTHCFADDFDANVYARMYTKRWAEKQKKKVAARLAEWE